MLAPTVYLLSYADNQNGNLKTPKFPIFNSQLSIPRAEREYADGKVPSLRAGPKPDLPTKIKFSKFSCSIFCSYLL